MSDTEDTPPTSPTPGMRLNYDATTGDFLMSPGEKMVTLTATHAQHEANVAYINWLIETDEKRRQALAKLHAGSQDILVDMGDLTRVNLDNIRLDSDYESMTEDIIQNVNHIILQGIEPIKAIFSLSQAFAIVLGFALRANMPFEVAKALITQVMKSATASEQMVRIITKQ